jgi:hypothetical protein
MISYTLIENHPRRIMPKPESPTCPASAAKHQRVIPGIIACLAASMLAAPGQQAVRPEFPAGIRLAAAARGEDAITALGGSTGPYQKQNG